MPYARKTGLSRLRRAIYARNRIRKAKKRGRKMVRRRPYRRSRTSRRATNVSVAAARGITLWPKIKYMRHRYRCIINVAEQTSGGYPLYPIQAYRANSLYDPDYSAATGVSASLLSTMALHYQKYCVLGSKISVKVFGNQQTPNMVSLIKLDNDTSNMTYGDTWASWRDDLNTSMCKWMLNPLGSYGGICKNQMSIKTFLGAGQTIVENDWEATTGSNPSTACYFYVMEGRRDGSGSGCPAHSYEINIEYFVRWTRYLDKTSAHTDFKTVADQTPILLDKTGTTYIWKEGKVEEEEEEKMIEEFQKIEGVEGEEEKN